MPHDFAFQFFLEHFTRPENYKTAIILRHSEEKSYEEISQILNIPLGTVKARIFRAREMLKKKLKGKVMRH